MRKHFYIIFYFLLNILIIHAQSDSYIRSVPTPKRHASAYDTNAAYFNKWKLNFTLSVGYLNADSYVIGNTNYPGALGILNPQYNAIVLPSINLSGSYGITEKSALGLSLFFQQTNFVPDSSSPYLSAGNVPLFGFEARYMHCMRSWKTFYYGFQYGEIYFQCNYNPNTFTSKPLIPPFFVQQNAGWFVGARFHIMKNAWVNFEIQESIPLISRAGYAIVNETAGFNYCIDTRKTCHKPVKVDPDTLPARHLHVKLRRQDSLLFPHMYYNPFYSSLKDKHLRSVYDTTSPYYNKGKLNISVEAGNGYIEAEITDMFGTLNSNYTQSILPQFSVSADYGIRKKSDIGIDIAFTQVNYKPAYSYLNLNPGNISVYVIDARYIHSIWSWKCFYYGFKLGVAFWKPEVSSGTFYNPPATTQPLTQSCGGMLLGTRINLGENISIHGELDFTFPIGGVAYGVTYRIDTKKREIK